MKAQRLRFRYCVTPEALGLGQRDLVRAFEEALEKAGLPLARSEGKRAGALISLAAPLPQGVTSEGELADVFFAEVVRPDEALKLVASAMRPGIAVVGVEEVGVGAPSLQSQLRWAVYDVRLPMGAVSEAEVRAKIDGFMAERSHPAEIKREKKTKSYDLRPLVLDMKLNGMDEDCLCIAMTLRTEQENTARADQTIAELGLPEPASIHRRCLRVEEIPAVVQAFRAAGERER
jgi:radical SAM-linked protein